MRDLQVLIANSQSGDLEARERLVEENAGLIWSVCRRFNGRGVEIDDLFQLGCLGFLKAVDGFDLQYGTQFSTYAVPKIAGEIRRFMRDDGAVKVSRSLKEQALQIKNIRTKLYHVLGREPTIQEISNQTGLTPEEIAIAENAIASVESIHQSTGEEGFALEHVLSDTESEDGFLEKIALRQAIANLPDREKKVIHLRFFHGLTQAQVSKILSVSQVQISRIEKRGIERLREMIM